MKSTPPLDPRLERLKLILRFLGKNWPALLLILIFVKTFGLMGVIESLTGLADK